MSAVGEALGHEAVADGREGVEALPVGHHVRLVHRAAVDLHLRTCDGLRLLGRSRSRPDAHYTVVLVHGFSASRDDDQVCALARDLFDNGYNVVSYDARGHGQSEGLSGVGSTEHFDVACAVEVAGGNGLPVILLGISMGAVAVVNYLASNEAQANDVAGAVLVSAPARWRMRLSPVGLLTAALTRTAAGRLYAARLMRVRVAKRWQVGEPPHSVVGRISVPLAIVHGASDRLLGAVHGRDLQACAAGPTKLVVVPGMGHGPDELSRKAVLDALGWVGEASAAQPVSSTLG